MNISSEIDFVKIRALRVGTSGANFMQLLAEQLCFRFAVPSSERKVSQY